MSAVSDWRRTSPLAVLFFFGRVFKGIAKNFTQAIAPMAAFAVAWPGSTMTKIVIAVSAVTLFSVTYSVLRYLFFRFRIEEDSILIRDGIFNKTQLDIKYDRIQGVNEEQGPVARALGLVDLTLETAGSSSSEGNLPAVERSFADALREKIDRTPRTSAPDSAEPEPVDAESSVILRLGNRDMIRIGLSDRRVLIVLAFLGPLLEQTGDRLDDYFDQYLGPIVTSFGGDVASGVLVLAALVLGVILTLTLISIGIAFWSYHGFTLMLDGRTLRSKAGLATTQNISMDVKKVQRIVVQQGIVLGWFARWRMNVQQATSSAQEKASFKIPLISGDTAQSLTRQLFETEGQSYALDVADTRFSRVAKRYIVTRTLVLGVLPAALLAVPISIGTGPFALLTFVWVLPVYLIVRRVWKRLAWYTTDDMLVKRRGFLGYRMDAFLLRKVQRVTIKQSLFQRRRGLATLQLFLANGHIDLPYIEESTANQIRDYVLFRVESSKQDWH
ncbi:MAG: PH domain-containing protein [Pseudomonadota bacterium]